MNKIKIAVFIFGALVLPATSFAAFDTDLRYGSSGAPVFELQEFLTDQGVYTGPITGNFYSLTLAGVKAFQSKQSVSPVSGFFGPISRGVANGILSEELKASDAEASTTPIVNTSPRPMPKNSSSQTPSSATPAGQLGAANSGFTINATTSLGKGDNKGIVYFKVDTLIDEAHLFFDNGHGKPGGATIGDINGTDFEFGQLPPGTYSWTMTATKSGQKATTSGSVTIE